MSKIVKRKSDGSVRVVLTEPQAIILAEIIGRTNDGNLNAALAGSSLSAVYVQFDGVFHSEERDKKITGTLNSIRFVDEKGESL